MNGKQTFLLFSILLVLIFIAGMLVLQYRQSWDLAHPTPTFDAYGAALRAQTLVDGQTATIIALTPTATTDRSTQDTAAANFFATQTAVAAR